MAIRESHWLVKVMNKSVYRLMVPVNLSFNWNFGSLLGFCLMIQIISGILLAFHYCPDPLSVFSLVVENTREVNQGWLIRYSHANGASFFFVCLYWHIGRGIYYGGYTNPKVWMIGMSLFALVMVESFLGYVLVWGQMSYWGATVITNLLSAVPYIGGDMVEWIWGGYVIGGATLSRFYVFHFCIPFVLLIGVVLHLVYLHESGTDGLLGVSVEGWKIPFSPYYLWKDVLGFIFLSGGLFFVVTLMPEFFLDPINNCPADEMQTPAHIKPEWYFLFAYAILRSVPSKGGGVALLGLSILVVLLLPVMVKSSKYRGAPFSVLGQSFFWVFVLNFFLLTWEGLSPACSPYIELSGVSSFFYFFYFLIILNTKF